MRVLSQFGPDILIGVVLPAIVSVIKKTIVQDSKAHRKRVELIHTVNLATSSPLRQIIHPVAASVERSILSQSKFRDLIELIRHNY